LQTAAWLSYNSKHGIKRTDPEGRAALKRRQAEIEAEMGFQASG
jgi:hypothetical protein